MIDYTELTHSGQPRTKLSFAEFVAECAAVSKSTIDHVLEHHEIVPCECGLLECPGWKATYLLRNKRRKVEAR